MTNNGGGEKNKDVIPKIKEANGKFKDKKLLNNILKELNETHYGDEREKMFVFFTMISSRLPPRYRLSTGLIGDSSEGKTNIINVCKALLPKNWYIQLDRITGSCVEDDLYPYDLIIWKEMNEKGLMGNTLDYIKALTEDGLDVLKKKKVEGEFSDTWTPNKISIDRKAGVHSSTETEYNEEFATRHCPVSITGDAFKYKKVNDITKDITGDPKKEIDILNRYDNENWMSKGLEQLIEFDVITIPDVDVIEERTDNPRCMRDLKRFLNVVRVIAWLNQYSRKKEKIDGKKVLYATPEDVYNAYLTSEMIFNQAYISMGRRDSETYNTLKKLVEEKGQWYDPKTVGEMLSSYKWVERNALQNRLNLSLSGVKKRIKSLVNIGKIVQINPRGNIALLSTTCHSACFLHDTDLFLMVTGKEIYKKMSDRQVTGKRQVSDTQSDRQIDEIISYKDTLPVTKNEIYMGEKGGN